MHTCCGSGFETPDKGRRREGEPSRGSCSSDERRSSLLALSNLGVADFHSIVPDLLYSGHFVSCTRKRKSCCPQLFPALRAARPAGAHILRCTVHVLFLCRGFVLGCPLAFWVSCCKGEPRPLWCFRGPNAKNATESQGLSKNNKDSSEVEFCATPAGA